jgi:hypothetical protein
MLDEAGELLVLLTTTVRIYVAVQCRAASEGRKPAASGRRATSQCLSSKSDRACSDQAYAPEQ